MTDKPHAEYSPSSRYRWSKCPASVDHHVSTSNAATEEGTRAHEVLEYTLLGYGKLFYDVTIYSSYPTRYSSFADWVKDPLYPKEMWDFAELTFREVLTKLELANIELTNFQVEVLLGHNTNKNFGTCDWMFDFERDGVKSKVLIDYKYGMQPVAVENNPQLLNYACLDYIWSTGSTNGFTQYIIGIYQPRAGGFSYQVIPIEQISLECRKLRKEINTLKIFKAGAHCKWCSHKPNCREYQKTNKELALSVFKQIETKAKPELPLDLCAEIITKEKQLNDFIKYCKQKVFDALIDHQEVPGFKLVKGTGNRTWSKPDKAAQRLASLGVTPYEQKVVSPTQVEKISKEIYTEVEEFVVRPEGKIRLVPESNKLPAIPNPLDVFEFQEK